MRNALRSMLPLLALLALPAIASAQTGCTDSPENPTIVLALVGSGAAAFSTLRGKLCRRNRRVK
jgi:XrtJ-associated TM-motif-TM protein